jgi:small subunit ribosomal protein S17
MMNDMQNTAQKPGGVAGPHRTPRKVVVGTVTSTKMQKTIAVRIPRYVPHRDYGKFIRRFTVCKVHDEKQEAAVGDTVRIMETRPLSRTKRWRLVAIVTRTRRPAEATAAAAPAPLPR